MALLTAVTPTFAGVTTTAGSVTSSDTIADATVSPNGCILHVHNASGGSMNVTISDPGFSPLGNAGTAGAVAIANGAAKAFRIPPAAVNPSTGVATVAFSATTSVTYELFKL